MIVAHEQRLVNKKAKLLLGFRLGDLEVYGAKAK